MTDSQPTDVNPAAGQPRSEMTLSEEQLVINTELVETGRARLVKRVEVETVTRSIQLRREVLEIERLDPPPATGTHAPGPSETQEDRFVPTVLEIGELAPGSFQEGVIEIVLMQEEALITTQLVPRERVRVTKQIVTENRTVDVDLDAEHVDLEQRPR